MKLKDSNHGIENEGCVGQSSTLTPVREGVHGGEYRAGRRREKRWSSTWSWQKKMDRGVNYVVQDFGGYKGQD